MKFTLSWLFDHLDSNLAPEMIAAKLNTIGHEVEKLTRNDLRLQGFIIAEIASCQRHPEAERLWLCQVAISPTPDTNLVTVICGAPNVYTGMKAVYAAPGQKIPASGKKLKVSKIRGIASHGMLLSAYELGLGTDHDGIIELSSSAPVGGNFATLAQYADVVFDIGVTSNRPDCLGVRGIARDLAAAGAGKLKPLPAYTQAASKSPHPSSDAATARTATNSTSPETTDSTTSTNDNHSTGAKLTADLRWEITAAAQEYCPFVAGCLVSNVTNLHAPDWMRHRLTLIGARSISALVDISNYLMYDFGRPLHFYDADKVTASKTLQMDVLTQPQQLATLDGKTHHLPAGTTIIAADTTALGIAGIVGGEASSCTADTKRVFIESAYFTPSKVFRTGRRLNIVSEARHRFERGIDPDFTARGAQIAANAIANICGGTIGPIHTAGTLPQQARKIKLTKAKLDTYAGQPIAFDRAANLLQQLGFELTSTTNTELNAKVPGWRSDVTTEACLIEEVLRLIGLDALPEHKLPDLAPPRLAPPQVKLAQVRRLLAANGYQEVVSLSFAATNNVGQQTSGSNTPAAPSGEPTDQALVIANPLSQEQAQLRTSLIHNLLLQAQSNWDKGEPGASFFEIGPVFIQQHGQPLQRNMLALLLLGQQREQHWLQHEQQADGFAVKAILLSALRQLGVSAQQLTSNQGANDWYHPQQSQTLRRGKLELASFGMLSPRIHAQYDIKAAVAIAEINLAELEQQLRPSPVSRPPLQVYPYPKVARDLAFVLSSAVTGSEINSELSKLLKAPIVEMTIIDRYQGKQLPADKMNMAFRFFLQSQNHTLTEAEITAALDPIITTMQQRFTAELRRA